MIRAAVLVFTVFLLALLYTRFAEAQQPICGTHPDVVNRLNTQFKEFRVGHGVAADGSLFEVFARKDQKRTWTLTITRPGGKTCLAAVGEHWFNTLTLRKEETY